MNFKGLNYEWIIFFMIIIISSSFVLVLYSLTLKEKSMNIDKEQGGDILERDVGNDKESEEDEKEEIAQEEVTVSMDFVWPLPEFESLPATFAYAWNEETPEFDNIANMLHVSRLPPIESRIQKMLDWTNAQPEGRKVILLRDKAYREIWENSNCLDSEVGGDTGFRCLWWDNGLNIAKPQIADLFSTFKNSGGKLDAVILDTEKGFKRAQINRCKIYDDSCPGPNEPERSPDELNEHWQVIENDLRFDEELKQELINLGYFSPNEFLHLNDTVLIHRENSQPQPEAFDNYLVWDALMIERAANYLDWALYDSIKQSFPNIAVSDFNYQFWNPKYSIPSVTGHLVQNYGSGEIVGTHQAPVFYGQMRVGLTLHDLDKDGDRDETKQDEFNSFRYELNKARGNYLAAPNIPINPWLTLKNWNGGIHSNYLRNSDYYEELVLHIGFLGVDTFLYWNPGDNGYDASILSGILKELDYLIGYEGREILTDDLTSWENDFVYSGMKIEGYKVWRFTPRGDAEVLEGDDVVFNVGGKSVVFPDAVIYDVTDSVTSAGHWVIQFPNSESPYLI